MEKLISLASGPQLGRFVVISATVLLIGEFAKVRAPHRSAYHSLACIVEARPLILSCEVDSAMFNMHFADGRIYSGGGRVY
jgi:hypothetical protein